MRTVREAILIALALLFLPGHAQASQLLSTWTDNSNNEDGFRIERKVGTGGTYTEIAVLGPNVTSYADWGLISGGTYCYRVRAFNSAGYSAYSNEGCGTATSVGQGEPRIVTAQGSQGAPRVRGFTATGLATGLDFMAYNSAFTGGVSVAVGIVDGAAAVITGAGSGGGPHVQTFRLSGAPTGASFMAYYPGFRGGVRVAACDLDGDGQSEIITAAGPGGGPHVRIWSVTGTTVTEVAGFYAYDPGFTGGVFVACGDIDGDGRAEVITGTGAGGGPHVRVWRVVGKSVSEVAGFMAYSPTFLGGTFVAAGDVDGDGRAEVVTGPGLGGGPHVRIWRVATNGAVSEVVGFMAYAPTFAGGVRVGAVDIDSNGRADIITGAGPGGSPHVRTFSVTTGVIPGLSFYAYDPAFTGGVFVAGVP